MSGNPTAAQWLGIDKLHRVGGYALPTLIDKLDLPSPLGWQQRQEACSRTRESLKYSEVPRVCELAKHARHQPVYQNQDTFAARYLQTYRRERLRLCITGADTIGTPANSFGEVSPGIML